VGVVKETKNNEIDLLRSLVNVFYLIAVRKNLNVFYLIAVRKNLVIFAWAKNYEPLHDAPESR